MLTGKCYIELFVPKQQFRLILQYYEYSTDLICISSVKSIKTEDINYIWYFRFMLPICPMNFL